MNRLSLKYSLIWENHCSLAERPSANYVSHCNQTFSGVGDPDAARLSFVFRLLRSLLFVLNLQSVIYQCTVEVTMADEDNSSDRVDNETPKPEKMFTLKKWNAVAMWSWDVECDTCAICRVQVMGEYRVNITYTFFSTNGSLRRTDLSPGTLCPPFQVGSIDF